jgi:hypothetical protein
VVQPELGLVLRIVSVDVLPLNLKAIAGRQSIVQISLDELFLGVFHIVDQAGQKRHGRGEAVGFPAPELFRQVLAKVSGGPFPLRSFIAGWPGHGATRNA